MCNPKRFRTDLSNIGTCRSYLPNALHYKFGTYVHLAGCKFTPSGIARVRMPVLQTQQGVSMMLRMVDNLVCHRTAQQLLLLSVPRSIRSRNYQIDNIHYSHILHKRCCSEHGRDSNNHQSRKYISQIRIVLEEAAVQPSREWARVQPAHESSQGQEALSALCLGGHAGQFCHRRADGYGRLANSQLWQHTLETIPDMFLSSHACSPTVTVSHRQ